MMPAMTRIGKGRFRLALSLALSLAACAHSEPPPDEAWVPLPVAGVAAPPWDAVAADLASRLDPVLPPNHAVPLRLSHNGGGASFIGELDGKLVAGFEAQGRVMLSPTAPGDAGNEVEIEITFAATRFRNHGIALKEGSFTRLPAPVTIAAADGRPLDYRVSAGPKTPPGFVMVAADTELDATVTIRQGKRQVFSNLYAYFLDSRDGWDTGPAGIGANRLAVTAPGDGSQPDAPFLWAEEQCGSAVAVLRSQTTIAGGKLREFRFECVPRL